MKVKKDTLLLVKSNRKGVFKARAKEDFDTDKVLFYPVIAMERVFGLTTTWEVGDEIPCRKGVSTIQIFPTGE